MLYYGIDFTEETLDAFFALHVSAEPGHGLLLNPLYASPSPLPSPTGPNSGRPGTEPAEP